MAAHHAMLADRRELVEVMGLDLIELVREARVKVGFGLRRIDWLGPCSYRHWWQRRIRWSVWRGTFWRQFDRNWLDIRVGWNWNRAVRQRSWRGWR